MECSKLQSIKIKIKIKTEKRSPKFNIYSRYTVLEITLRRYIMNIYYYANIYSIIQYIYNYDIFIFAYSYHIEHSLDRNTLKSSIKSVNLISRKIICVIDIQRQAMKLVFL